VEFLYPITKARAARIQEAVRAIDERAHLVPGRKHPRVQPDCVSVDGYVDDATFLRIARAACEAARNETRARRKAW